MVKPLICDIQRITLPFHIFMHQCDCLRFIIVGTDMHTLYTKAFIISHILNFGEICFLFLCCLINSPVKIRFCHKIRQADHGNPPEILFMSIVDSCDSRLPPEALQRRNDIIEIAVNLMVSLFAHLDGECDPIKQSDRLLVFAILLVRITLPTNSKIIHFRDQNDAALFNRQLNFCQPFLRTFFVPDSVNVTFPRQPCRFVVVLLCVLHNISVCITNAVIRSLMKDTEHFHRGKNPESDFFIFPAHHSHSFIVADPDIGFLVFTVRIFAELIGRFSAFDFRIQLQAFFSD